MADYITCSIKDMTPDQLSAALLTKNTQGEMAIRVVFVDGCALDAIDCSNNILTKEQTSALSIGISSCGKPALRLALPKGTFLNNIPSYANDTVAGNAGLEVGDIYFNTTTNKLRSVQEP